MEDAGSNDVVLGLDLLENGGVESDLVPELVNKALVVADNVQ